MSPNVAAEHPWEWDGRKARAATLLAEGTWTDAEVAAEVGVTDRTVLRWKLRPEFRARVEGLAREIGDATLRVALARRLRRLRELQDQHDRLMAIVHAWAADPAHRGLPGYESGMVIRRQRSIGSGDNARTVEEHEPDVALSRELREIKKQIAQEVGQWSARHEVRGVVANVSVIPEIDELRKMPIEELLRIHRESLGYTAPEQEWGDGRLG